MEITLIYIALVVPLSFIIAIEMCFVLSYRLKFQGMNFKYGEIPLCVPS